MNFVCEDVRAPLFRGSGRPKKRFCACSWLWTALQPVALLSPLLFLAFSCLLLALKFIISHLLHVCARRICSFRAQRETRFCAIGTIGAANKGVNRSPSQSAALLDEREQEDNREVVKTATNNNTEWNFSCVPYKKLLRRSRDEGKQKAVRRRQ